MTEALELRPHPRFITDLLLIRHGLTDWNVEHRIQGWEPVPINEEGRAQARRAGELLGGRSLSGMVSSPVLRAVQTAEIVRETMGLELAIDTHPGLGEFRMGAWEKQIIHDLRKIGAWGEYLRHPERTTFPGGESVADIQRRAVGAVNEIVAGCGGGTIALVTHGGIVRLLVLTAFGMPLSGYHRTHVDNASICQLRLIPGIPPKVLAVNLTGAPLRTL